MCGPSSEQTAIAGQQQTLGTTLAANYQNNYAAQGNILNELNQELSPISEAGPEQQGFGANERAALQTEATTGVATNYNKAATALGMSTRGSVPAGAARAQQETLATNAAKESAGLTRANTVANYNTGRANFANVTAGVNALAQTYAPTQTAQVAGAGLGNAYGSATTNAQAGAQEFGEIAGGVAALASAGANINTAVHGNQPQTYGTGAANNYGLDPATGQQFQTTNESYSNTLQEPNPGYVDPAAQEFQLLPSS